MGYIVTLYYCCAIIAFHFLGDSIGALVNEKNELYICKGSSVNKSILKYLPLNGRITQYKFKEELDFDCSSETQRHTVTIPSSRAKEIFEMEAKSKAIMLIQNITGFFYSAKLTDYCIHRITGNVAIFNLCGSNCFPKVRPCAEEMEILRQEATPPRNLTNQPVAGIEQDCSAKYAGMFKTEFWYLRTLHQVFVPTSVFFLVLIIVAHGLLWKQLNGIHNLTVIGYVATLACEYISSMWKPLDEQLLSLITSTNSNPDSQEYAYAFFAYSTLCWLILINFNILVLVRRIRNFKILTSKLQRFSIYILFAWTTPILLIFIGECVHPSTVTQLFNEGSPNDKSCDLTNFDTFIVMQYVFTGMLLAFSCVFFATTVFELWTQNRANNAPEPESRHKKNSMQQFGVKLFIVMGGVWMVDTVPHVMLYCISGFKKVRAEPFLMKLIYLSLFTEFVSLVEAFALFYIFIFLSSIYSKLWAKYPQFCWAF